MINKDTYKRLTNKNLDEFNPKHDFCIGCKEFGESNGCNRWNGACANYEDFNELYNRLAELEDKIENGMFIELPCKVGDTLYFPQYYCDSRGCSMHEQSYCCGCKEMITRERNNEKYIIATKHCEWNDIPTIGKKYFVTRAEAEVKLKELQEGKNG